MNSRTPIFAANWKMNKALSETADFVSRFQPLLAEIPTSLGKSYEVVLAPPATHLTSLAKYLSGTKILLGAQNCGGAKSGAFTGEISPVVLKELGCETVILGHSERRHVFQETDALVLTRCKAALEEGLQAMLCVGEKLEDRKAGKTFTTIERQLSILKDPKFPTQWNRMVIAYEPVWAIGTGENATPEQAEEVHAFIRDWFSKNISSVEAPKMRILYGGSVKPENSAAIMSQKNVDGLLVGGASLDPVTFAGVVKNGLKSRT